jgi:hypothetical protein
LRTECCGDFLDLRREKIGREQLHNKEVFTSTDIRMTKEFRTCGACSMHEDEEKFGQHFNCKA